MIVFDPFGKDGRDNRPKNNLRAFWAGLLPHLGVKILDGFSLNLE